MDIMNYGTAIPFTFPQPWAFHSCLGAKVNLLYCVRFLLTSRKHLVEVMSNCSWCLQVVCDTLMHQLDKIPGDRRTLVGFITFSNSVQFYLMGEGMSFHATSFTWCTY